MTTEGERQNFPSLGIANPMASTLLSQEMAI